MAARKILKLKNKAKLKINSSTVTEPNISKILLQPVPNMRVTNKIFYIPFACQIFEIWCIFLCLHISIPDVNFSVERLDLYLDFMQFTMELKEHMCLSKLFQTYLKVFQ